MMRASWIAAGIAAAAVMAVPAPGSAQDEGVVIETILTRAGAQLERYFQRAQRIIATEIVLVRSFDRAMQLNGFPRRLEYERRVEWEAAGEDGVPSVTVLRRLLSVNGRDPEPGDEDGCQALGAEGEHPLAFLLPVRQSQYEFTLVEIDVVDGREVAQVEYWPLEATPGEVTWEDECLRIELDGWHGGEVWIDIESSDVLRHDEHLRHRFEFREPQDRPRASVRWMTLERDDTVTRYERVAFQRPDETLMLPRSIEKSWSFEGSGIVPRYFRSQQFENYRRFVTEGRLLGASTAAQGESSAP